MFLYWGSIIGVSKVVPLWGSFEILCPRNGKILKVLSGKIYAKFILFPIWLWAN